MGGHGLSIPRPPPHGGQVLGISSYRRSKPHKPVGPSYKPCPAQPAPGTQAAYLRMGVTPDSPQTITHTTANTTPTLPTRHKGKDTNSPSQPSSCSQALGPSQSPPPAAAQPKSPLTPLYRLQLLLPSLHRRVGSWRPGWLQAAAYGPLGISNKGRKVLLGPQL